MQSLSGEVNMCCVLHGPLMRLSGTALRRQQHRRFPAGVELLIGLAVALIVTIDRMLEGE